MTWAVDIPNRNSEDWDEVTVCDTRDEAIRFARERFGADEEGKVTLVTGPHVDDSTIPEDHTGDESSRAEEVEGPTFG